MAVIVPTSTSVSGVDALSVGTGHTVLVREGVTLTADGGSAFDGIDVFGVGNTIVVDGYVFSDEGDGIELDLASNQILVGSRGIVASNGDAIYAATAALGTVITNDGSIIGRDNAIQITGSSADDPATVTNNGSVTSTVGDAIVMNMGGIVSNAGSISSASSGVYLGIYSGNNGFNVLNNSGQITAEYTGVRNAGASSQLSNSGEIIGAEGYGIRFEGTAINTSFINTGLLSGRLSAVSSSATGVTVTNSGSMIGNTAIQFDEANQSLSNSGTIIAISFIAVTSSAQLTLSNSGVIEGQTTGIYGGSHDTTTSGVGNHSVGNSGTITGTSQEAIRLVGSGTQVSNAAGGVINSKTATSSAILIQGNDSSVTNAGQITSVYRGITTLVGAEISNSGDIATGDDGISVSGNGIISNTGNIAADDDGIRVQDGGSYALVSNHGVITASGQGIEITEQDHAQIINTGAINALQSGIYNFANEGTIQNSGAIIANHDAIRIAGGQRDLDFQIQNSGMLSGGSFGVNTLTGARIDNSGTIQGAAGIIVNSGDTSGVTRITNSGLVEGLTQGIMSQKYDQGFELFNTGDITGGTTSIWYALMNASVVTRITNEGFIGGGVQAILAGSGNEVIRNAGLIAGDVFMGLGTDLFEGMGGIVNGRVLGGDGNDTLGGGSEADVLDGEAQFDLIMGRAGDDTLLGGDGNDTILGGLGDDSINAGRQSDFVGAGEGNDSVVADSGDDTVYGYSGDDTIYGNDGFDLIYGGDGDDSLNGGNGADTIHGGNGNDSIDGFAAQDVLYGGAGNDLLNGWADGDTMHGGEGNDTLIGGAGWDRLDGGHGDDELSGGAAAGEVDHFVFIRFAGNDVITDFENNIDKIDLTAFSTSYGAMSGAISDYNGGALIDLNQMGGQGSIWVQGVPASFLNANDFIF